MVLIWSGRGILVFFIFIVMAAVSIFLTVTQIAVPYGLGDDQSVKLATAIAALLSAVVTLPIGRLVMRPRGSGRAPDTLLWIDVRYWTYIFAAIAVLMLAAAFLL